LDGVDRMAARDFLFNLNGSSNLKHGLSPAAVAGADAFDRVGKDDRPVHCSRTTCYQWKTSASYTSEPSRTLETALLAIMA
jgi:hypothetical protein